MCIPPRASSPWQKSREHRDRRGARLTRREEGEYREYLTDEQRRQPGCIVGRMPRDFCHGLLDVQIGDGQGVALDEIAPGFDMVAHQRAEDLVGRDGVLDSYLGQAPGLGVDRGIP